MSTDRPVAKDRGVTPLVAQVLRGGLMGAADIVPGVSGGTHSTAGIIP